MLLRSAIGGIALLAAFTPLVAGARSLRQRLLPEWCGPPGWLAQLVVILGSTLVVVLALGIVGLYSLLPTTVALAASGIAMMIVATRIQTRPGDRPAVVPERLGRPATVIAAIAVSFVAANWSARVYVALSHGIVSHDSLWYHLPLAARYSQLHSITGIYNDVPDLSGFYPINGELMHSLGMVFLGNDFLSVAINLGWGVVALLAAWCIGRPYGTAAVCTTGLAVLLCAPGFVGTQPGSAHVDIVGVAVVLTTAALVVSAGASKLTSDSVVLSLAALMVGFAVGTKWTFLPISAALTLGVIILLPRGRRLGRSSLWIAIVTLFGCFSYVRNLVKANSPLPPVDLAVGGVGWQRQVPEPAGVTSLMSIVFDDRVWTNWLRPGLTMWFGFGWWAVLTLALFGLALSVATRTGAVVRLLGCAGIVAIIAFIVQPQLLLLGTAPLFIAANLRYATAGIALGLVLLPLSPVCSGRVIRWLVPSAFLVIVLVMQLDPTLWPTELRDLRWENPVRGSALLAGVVAGVVTLVAGLGLVFGRNMRRGSDPAIESSAAPVFGGTSRQRRVIALLAIPTVLLISALAVDRWYLARRYAEPDAATPWLDQHWISWEWARDIEGARIGAGPTAFTYPLYGKDLSNVVKAFPAEFIEQGGSPTKNTPAGCERFVRWINENRLTHIVLYGASTPTQHFSQPPELAVTAPQLLWLDADPAATQLLREPLEAVYRIDGELDPAACRGDER